MINTNLCSSAGTILARNDPLEFAALSVSISGSKFSLACSDLAEPFLLRSQDRREQRFKRVRADVQDLSGDAADIHGVVYPGGGPIPDLSRDALQFSDHVWLKLAPGL